MSVNWVLLRVTGYRRKEQTKLTESIRGDEPENSLCFFHVLLLCASWPRAAGFRDGTPGSLKLWGIFLLLPLYCAGFHTLCQEEESCTGKFRQCEVRKDFHLDSSLPSPADCL